MQEIQKDTQTTSTQETEISKLEDLATEIEVEVSQANEELREALKKSNLTLEAARNEIKEGLKKSLEAAEQAGNKKLASNIREVMAQAEQAETLEFLKKGGTVRKPVTNKEFRAIEKAAREKLRVNKKFTFRDIKGLDETLHSALPDGLKEYARTFLHRFYAFIVRNKLEDHAVTISQVINNINAMKNPESVFRREFLGHIIEVILSMAHDQVLEDYDVVYVSE